MWDWQIPLDELPSPLSGQTIGAYTLDRLGDVLLRQSQFDEAEPLLREALARRRRILGDAHASTADSMTHLATLL